MRLLLDEMYSASIAEGLRERGHDALAATERPDLCNIPDAELFATAQVERRTVATENVRDFVPIANDFDARGESHHGLILISPRRYLRGSRRTVGAIVTALDALAQQMPGDEPTSLRHWL